MEVGQMYDMSLGSPPRENAFVNRNFLDYGNDDEAEGRKRLLFFDLGFKLGVAF